MPTGLLPCRALAPTIEAFADSAQGKVKVVKHNTQDHEQTAANHKVSAIPTLLLFHGGKEVHRLVGGGRTVDDLKKIVTEYTGVEAVIGDKASDAPPHYRLQQVFTTPDYDYGKPRPQVLAGSPEARRPSGTQLHILFASFLV